MSKRRRWSWSTSECPRHTAEGLEAARHIRQDILRPASLFSQHTSRSSTPWSYWPAAVGLATSSSRVTDVAEFIQTLQRIVKGGSVVDPALVAELVAARRRDDPLAVLGPREQGVSALMAEGRSNAGI